MKTVVTILIAALAALVVDLLVLGPAPPSTAPEARQQVASEPPSATRPARREEPPAELAVEQTPDVPSPSERRDERAPYRNARVLTPEQRARVKAILSAYKPSSLTASDAHAINQAFRAAGLRNGPALMAAIREAGFDPQRIGQLDPPRGGGDASPRPPRGDAEVRVAREDRAGEKHSGDGRPSDGGRRPEGGARAEGGRRGEDGTRGYSIDQAVSDHAQLTTIAFSGLAFLTGDMGCNTFLPPGKVADYCGFQYMRDVDRGQLGHNTSFLPRAANNVLAVLDPAQKAQLVALAGEQEQLLTDFAWKRFPLIKAFSRLLAGDLPANARNLSQRAVMAYCARLYDVDGLLAWQRAEVLGGIVRSLSDAQKARLEKLVFGDSSTWPELPDQIDKRTMSHMTHVAVMTYASELLSWYKGDVESDAYFCPERHATYFGSFYMKDIPAMGNPGYSISTTLTGDAGEAFLAALDPEQRSTITRLVNQQRDALVEIVQIRRSIAAELRRLTRQSYADRSRVMALSHRYGELDGQISCLYASAFTEVAHTLTPAQRAALLRLRNLDAKYACRGAFLYSEPIELPTIPDTDFLFEGSRTR